MTATFTLWTRRAAGTALAVALAAAVSTGFWVGGGTTNTAAEVSTRSVTPDAAPGVRVVLRVGDRAAAATLADTPPARQFAHDAATDRTRPMTRLIPTITNHHLHKEC